MELTKKHKIIIGSVIVIILLGLYVVLDKKSQNKIGENNSNAQSATTTTDNTNVQTQIETTGKGGYTIEQVPVTEGRVPQPIPSLTRKAVFSSSVSLTDDVKNAINSKISLLQSELSKKPENVVAWIDLGIYYKMAGDYEGSIISWKYASRLAPSDYISLGNLGNLYAYFLKDNAMAETYYKQAITKGPTQAYLYIQLSEVYRDIFKDNQKALAIINSGLEKIPNDPSLLEAKTNLSK